MYDIIIIGSGPGGYVAAIRATQLGKKVAVVERESLGGICLNWGCIPTKALLRSAQITNDIKNASSYGISIDNVKVDFNAIIKRSREISEKMSKGVKYLFKKNKIDLLQGNGKLLENKKVEVDFNGEKTIYEATNIIIATGSRAAQLPNIKIDGKKIIGYRQALSLENQPDEMLVIGSGAIGSELAYFYNSIGTKVTLVELLPTIVPNEDEEVAKQLARSFKKNKIKVFTNSSVEKVDISADKCKVFLKTKKGEEIIEADVVLSAVGITPNTENIGLEEVGISTTKGKIDVDNFYKTNIDGVFAIGDIVHGPALAHVASAEGIICVEKIAGLSPEKLDYTNIPACTYTQPELASVGLTEDAAIESGYEIRKGKFPFTASGKASASGHYEGFVKLIFNSKDDKIIGAHLIGSNVTEMIAEIIISKKMGATGHDILKSVHPHPTMSEAIMEAAASAYNEAIHI